MHARSAASPATDPPPRTDDGQRAVMGAPPCDTPEAGSWAATLRLAYARDARRTVAVARQHHGPLRVQKAFYPEDDVCHHVIVHPPGGIVGGDELRLEVAAQAGAAALLTTPGATRWYRSPGAAATQVLHVEVAAAASVEWLPAENIVYAGARACIDSRYDIAPGGCLIAMDVVCLGRPAGNETFSTGALRMSLSVCTGGRLRFAERVALQGADAVLSSASGLAGCSTFGLLVAAGRAVPDDVLARCRAIAVDGMLSVTQLPEVLVARWHGDGAELAQRALRMVWQTLRPTLLGRAACPPRIWAT